jgi:anthranilate phosphoribosyltransferase
MSPLLPFITQLADNQDLTFEQISEAACALASPSCPADDKRLFLIALSRKGETAQEVAGLAMTFRQLARDPGLQDWAPRAIDIVGTGGDGYGSFNISTVSAITVAAAGVPVIKHGNRAVTSKSGAADFLAMLGVPQNPPLELLRASMEQLNFCFLFAPSFHPAFKEIMPVRKALAEEGQRTVFNILGPLITLHGPPTSCSASSVPAGSAAGQRAPHAEDEARLRRPCRVRRQRRRRRTLLRGPQPCRGFGDFSGLDTVWQPKDLGLGELRAGTPQGRHGG